MAGWFSMDRSIRELDLSCSQKLVLVMLVTYTNGTGAPCFPSEPTLAQDCSLGIRTIRRAISALESKGHIEVDREPPSANRYSISPKLLITRPESPGHYVPESAGSSEDRPEWPGETPLPGHGGRLTRPESPVDPATVASEVTSSKKPKRSKKTDSQVHLKRGVAACKYLKSRGIPVQVWQKITKDRADLLDRRMAAEDLHEATRFWDAAASALAEIDPEHFEGWTSISLDILLRVPQRGNTNHFQKAVEGGYRSQDAKGESRFGNLKPIQRGT